MVRKNSWSVRNSVSLLELAVPAKVKAPLDAVASVEKLKWTSPEN